MATHTYSYIRTLKLAQEGLDVIPPELQLPYLPEDDNLKTFYFKDDQTNGFLDLQEQLDSVPNDVEAVVFPPFAGYFGWSWKHIAKLPQSIKVLILGHDGVTGMTNHGKCNTNTVYDTDQDVRAALIHLKNLTRLEFCGYHSHFGKNEFLQLIPNDRHVQFISID